MDNSFVFISTVLNHPFLFFKPIFRDSPLPLTCSRSLWTTPYRVIQTKLYLFKWIETGKKNHSREIPFTMLNITITIGHNTKNRVWCYCKQFEFRMSFFEANFFSNYFTILQLLRRISIYMNLKLKCKLLFLFLFPWNRNYLSPMLIKMAPGKMSILLKSNALWIHWPWGVFQHSSTKFRQYLFKANTT